MIKKKDEDPEGWGVKKEERMSLHTRRPHSLCRDGAAACCCSCTRGERRRREAAAASIVWTLYQGSLYSMDSIQPLVPSSDLAFTARGAGDPRGSQQPARPFFAAIQRSRGGSRGRVGWIFLEIMGSLYCGAQRLSLTAQPVFWDNQGTNIAKLLFLF